MLDKLQKMLADKRVIIFLVFLFLCLCLAWSRGLHFGIEFEGGTRIPITLERPVDAYTMSELVNNIKNRVSNFGLQQVLVKAIGDSEIYLELPKSDPELINNTINILKKQGKFEGIVDGKVALIGEEIMPGSIQEMKPLTQANNVKWEISFAVTESGAVHFAETVKGKAEYPVYMFLDRPENAVILITRSQLVGNATLTEQEALQVLNEVLRKDGTTIPMIIIDDWNSSKRQLAALNKSMYSRVIISSNSKDEILRELNQTLGFEVIQAAPSDMNPVFGIQPEAITVQEWRAVGLLSAPTLNKAITEGKINRFYTISGGVPGNMPIQTKLEIAQNETKNLKSILSGGALPVNIIIGTPTVIPAPFGEEFLKYSVFAGLVSVSLVIIALFLRYGNLSVVLPISFIVSSEIVILTCILGSLGTIDLGAMAGIIGAIGTGVNDQVVIADEVLSAKATGKTRKKIDKAFGIIITNATIAVVAMIPLLFFSGLVEIMGFALSVIIGVFIGALITRPAYGRIVEVIMEDKEEKT